MTHDRFMDLDNSTQALDQYNDSNDPTYYSYEEPYSF